MNFVISHKSLLGIVSLALVALVGTFALAVAETSTDTGTSTTEAVVETVSEAPATSTPEASAPIEEEVAIEEVSEETASTSTEEAAEETATTTEQSAATEETIEPAQSGGVSEATVESAPSIQEIGPKISEELDCTTSYVSDLYDTPSGHLEEGYFKGAVPATTTGKVAQKIGTQAWTICYDDADVPHEFTLTEQEYANLANPDATMPKKSILVPAL